MEKRTSAAARIFAALALAIAVVAVAIAVAGSLGGASSGGGGHGAAHAQRQRRRVRTTAATYTIQAGDTLTSIAHKTGVPVSELLALNPRVDPQILIAGETLKLR